MELIKCIEQWNTAQSSINWMRFFFLSEQPDTYVTIYLPLYR